MKHRIEWQYWRDPLNPADEWSKIERDFVPVGGDGDENPHDEGAVQARGFVHSAVGLIPVSPYLDLNKAFDFYIVETTFTIGDELANFIDSFPGVETLDILTRYRFRVAIGGMFDKGEVRTRLTRALLKLQATPVEENRFNLKPSKEMRSRVDAFAGGSEGRSWALIVLPNGFVDGFRSESAAEVGACLETYRNVQKTVGGVIYQYLDEAD